MRILYSKESFLNMIMKFNYLQLLEMTITVAPLNFQVKRKKK